MSYVTFTFQARKKINKFNSNRKTGIIVSSQSITSVVDRDQLNSTGNFIVEHLKKQGVTPVIISLNKELYDSLGESSQKFVEHLKTLGVPSKEAAADLTCVDEYRKSMAPRRQKKEQKESSSSSDDEK